MTGTAANRQAEADRNAPDHSPACPRCGDLCPPGSLICLSCWCRLTLDDCYPERVSDG